MTTEGDQTPPVGTPTPTPDKMVPEKDLLAVKGTAKKQVEDLKATHKVEIEKANEELTAAKSEHETARNEVLQAVAAKEQLEAKLQESAGSIVELASVKEQLVTAQKAVEEANNKLLENRRSVLVAQGISADTIKDKTSEQLDAYEEALKAIGSRGPGNYATTPGGGGAPVEETPHARALRILADAEAKGHVYSGTMKPPQD